LAVDPDAPAVRLDDALGDREAETGAEAGRAARLPEPLEDVRELELGDPGAAVGDREDDLFAAPLDRERDRSTRSRELHGVAEQVLEHLLHALAVAQDLDLFSGLLGRAPEREGETFCRSLPLLRLEGLARQVERAVWLSIDDEA